MRPATTRKFIQIARELAGIGLVNRAVHSWIFDQTVQLVVAKSPLPVEEADVESLKREYIAHTGRQILALKAYPQAALILIQQQVLAMEGQVRQGNKYIGEFRNRVLKLQVQYHAAALQHQQQAAALQEQQQAAALQEQQPEQEAAANGTE